ncbi:berberine bridge enzyme-like 22 [Nicotiana tabacum]|uniref:berberine bridge enzyme-like 22 n=1 Tax=Nicotiana tabacum TaxID=4097 RepID=UPI003F4E6BC8
MVSIVLLVLFLLTKPSHGNLQDFAICMTLHSISIVHSQGSFSYTYLLQAAEQNPRWLNSTSLLKPPFIVTPKTQNEIQLAILCSKKHALQVRVKSGGHDYEGLSFLCKTPFVIFDLVDFRSISINLEDETAWIQAGATIGEFYYNIAKKSDILGFPSGLCPSVGVGGLFSGGGIGTMMRKYDLSADNIIDANLVDANGRILNRETMGEDVFWAIRGGGGASFGVITAWKVKLVRVPPLVTVFTIHKSLDQEGVKLVHKWQYLASKLPGSLFIRVIIQQIDGPDSHGNAKPAELLFNSLFLGLRTDLVSIMNRSFPDLGLKMEDCAEMSWIKSVLYFTGYEKGEPLEVLLDRKTQYKSNFKGKSDFVVEPIPESVFQGISERFLHQKLAFMILDPLGGKMDEISESEIPFPHRKGNLYNIQYIVKWDSNDMLASQQPLYWMQRLYKYMEPYVSKSPRTAYINYRDLDLGINQQGNYSSYRQALTWGTKYFKGNFQRLARAKHQIDPSNFFTNEQSIPPLSC